MGEATPQRLEAMDRIVDNAVNAQAAGAVASMADSNQALHEAVIGLTGSESLRLLMARVLAQMRLVFHAMASAYDFHSHYVDRNVRLVELLRAGQRDIAAALLRDYLDDAEAELLQQITQDAPV